MTQSWHEGLTSVPPPPGVANAWIPRELSESDSAEPDTAEDTAVAVESTAFEQGFAMGLDEGARAERERLQTCLRALEEAVEVFSQSSAEWTGALEENIAALAVATARFVVDRELSTEPEAIARIVVRALTEFSVDEPVQVRLNPNDLAILHSLPPTHGAASLTMQGRCRWVADTQIVPGGCVVQGRERIVDGRVDSALERVYRRLVHQHA